MPSPVGHALGGIAAGWLVDRPRTVARTVLFAAAGMAPDLDLLIGVHRGPAHSLGFALIAGLVTLAFRSMKGGWSVRVPLAVTAAYATHTLLDWLGTDTSAPIGIMALWPLTRAYYESSLHVFTSISRRYWLSEFWVFNFRALTRELVVLVPTVVAVYYLRRVKRSPAV